MKSNILTIFFVAFLATQPAHAEIPLLATISLLNSCRHFAQKNFSGLELLKAISIAFITGVCAAELKNRIAQSRKKAKQAATKIEEKVEENDTKQTFEQKTFGISIAVVKS